jgi:hypothetical protein
VRQAVNVKEMKMNWTHIQRYWQQFKSNVRAALAAWAPAFESTSTCIFTHSLARPSKRSSMMKSKRHAHAMN